MTFEFCRRYAPWCWLLCFASAAIAAEPEKSPAIGAVEQRILAASGEFRQAQQRGKLAPQTHLTAAARDFARFMAQTGKYGHDADGRTPQGRAHQHGYDACIVAENIAYLFSSTPFGADELGRKFVHGWENSPGHRKNMLNPDVTQIGVGVARSDKTGYYYAVQLFGRPKSQAIKFELANQAGIDVPYVLGERSLTLPPGTQRTHEQCSAGQLSLNGTVVAPRNGDRYVITRSDSGKLELRKK
jgi:uncharacterized protein YkwD